MNLKGGQVGQEPPSWGKYNMPPQYITVNTTGLVSRSNVDNLCRQGDRWFIGRVTALLKVSNSGIHVVALTKVEIRFSPLKV